MSTAKKLPKVECCTKGGREVYELLVQAVDRLGDLHVEDAVDLRAVLAWNARQEEDPVKAQELTLLELLIRQVIQVDLGYARVGRTYDAIVKKHGKE